MCVLALCGAGEGGDMRGGVGAKDETGARSRGERLCVHGGGVSCSLAREGCKQQVWVMLACGQPGQSSSDNTSDMEQLTVLSV